MPSNDKTIASPTTFYRTTRAIILLCRGWFNKITKSKVFILISHFNCLFCKIYHESICSHLSRCLYLKIIAIGLGANGTGKELWHAHYSTSFSIERTPQPIAPDSRSRCRTTCKKPTQPHCHSCLEQMANGVLLLNNETKVIYATKEVDLVMKGINCRLHYRRNLPCNQSHSCFPLCRFRHGRNREAGTAQLAIGR